jgi:hypothetical protein
LYTKEIPLHDGAIFVIRHSRSLCLADHTQYKLIHVDPIKTIPLIPTPQEPVSPPAASGMLSSSSPQLVPRPVAAVVKADEFLMVSASASNHILFTFKSILMSLVILNPMNTNDWYILRCPWKRY